MDNDQYNESPSGINDNATSTEIFDDDDNEYYIIESEDGTNDGITLGSSRCSSEDEDNAIGEVVVSEDKGKLKKRENWPERVNMMYMRRYLESLKQDLETKDYQLQDSRAEQEKCKERLSELKNELETIIIEKENFIREGNVASEQLYEGKYKMVDKSIYRERKLLDLISLNVENAEYELAKCEVEIGRYQLVEANLHENENIEQQHLQSIAKDRRINETFVRNRSTKQRQNQKINDQKACEENDRKHKETLKRSKEAHIKMHTFVQQTINKIRKRVEEEEILERQQVTKRMDAIINLKNNITANRENIQAMQAKDAALAERRRNLEQRRNQSCANFGGNVSEMNARQKVLTKHVQSLRKEENLDKDRKIVIVEKLLQEELNMKKRKDLYPFLFDEKNYSREKIIKEKPKKKLKILEKMIKDDEPEIGIFNIDGSKFKDYADSDSDDNLTNFMTKENTMISNSEIVESEIIVKPEFHGLWKDHRPYNVPQHQELKPIGGSNMQKDIHARNLEIQRENIVHPQIAAGKEFRGQSSFNSKPEVVHFKDFDVGSTYRKKIILTNVSYTVNYCKFIGISDHLKDFIEISFESPGQLSAGLTCDLHVQFKPMINENLSGEIEFLTETGPFIIPLLCTIKKCELSVSSSNLDYGTAVIGETVIKSFILKNNGALPTKFEIYKVSQMKNLNLNIIEQSSALRSSPVMDSDVQVSPEIPSESCFDKQHPVLPNGSPVPQATSDVQTSLGNHTELNFTEMGEILLTDGFSVVQPHSLEICAFSILKIEISWQPLYSGKISAEFMLNFSDPHSEKICITTNATAIELPVWVSRENVDLHICMFDRLYQDTIILNNRASTALKLKFEVSKELSEHIELLPKTGYIQANSTFSAQLKFLPRKSLFTKSCMFFDPDTGVLEAPMVITVADQTRPVSFTVHAVVTNSDLDFDITTLDFGRVCIDEMCCHKLNVTNKSCLPQEFGFPACPDFVEVQPGDGFGILLPNETIQLDVLFKPSKADEYYFTITCKTIVDRQFIINCKGIAVHSPLSLSHQCLNFAATALYDEIHCMKVQVINDHLDTNEFRHPVPRIGKGSIAPVGPTSFCFEIDDKIPLKISPSVGCVSPGEKQSLMISYKPTLTCEEIRAVAVEMIASEETERLQKEYQSALASEQAEIQKRKLSGGKKDAKGKPNNKARTLNDEQQPMLTVQPPEEVIKKKPSAIEEGSDEYIAAVSALMRSFKGDFNSYVIPCYVTSGKCNSTQPVEYSEHNAIYLEVHCPSISPELVVISDKGRTKTDFNRVSIGQSVLYPITVQNISNKPIQLTVSCLDTRGPFSIQNSLRLLNSGQSHSILVRFTPLQEQLFQEDFYIYGQHSKLTLTLQGKGQMPVVSLSVQNGVMDMGSILYGEYREEPFKIINMSKLAVLYKITIDSNSLNVYKENQRPPTIFEDDKENKSMIGVSNNNGSNVFDCIPIEGSIEAGMTQEITVTFAPDHISDFYSEGIRINLFGEKESYVFRLIGQMKPHIMYLSGGEKLTPSIESLALKVVPANPSLELPDKHPKSAKKLKITPRSLPSHPLLVNMLGIQNDFGFQPAISEITVGCVRTMAVSQKKSAEQNKKASKEKITKGQVLESAIVQAVNGEFIFENLQALSSLGFTVEPNRGMIEAPNKKIVTITWNLPPKQNNEKFSELNKCIEATLICTLKSDVVEQVPIFLRARVVSK